jgi:dual specificity MAP kinase phosphatase
MSKQIFDVLIEASDVARVPDPISLRRFRSMLQKPSRKGPFHIEFPSSGSIMPPSWSHTEVDGLMDMCKWIYELANPQAAKSIQRGRNTEDEAVAMADVTSPRKILIHCTDGYTETSLLGLAYFMYAEGLPAHDAWVQLHRDKGRNFFAYPADVALLTQIQVRILQESPRFSGSVFHLAEPRWLSRIDGSLPSRILPYMYLGNLGHANNPELLRELGITRILSVGETITWSEDLKLQLAWPVENLMLIDGVQDNGVDPLWGEFQRCLDFIGEFLDAVVGSPLTKVRSREARWRGYPCTLPCWCFSISHDLHCGSHA